MRRSPYVHVSHRGWLTPLISSPPTYFITAVTWPSFNRSAVLSALRLAAFSVVHYVQRLRAPHLYLAPPKVLLNASLKMGGITSFWNLKFLMYVGQ
jgi:hypothetical protein